MNEKLGMYLLMTITAANLRDNPEQMVKFVESNIEYFPAWKDRIKVIKNNIEKYKEEQKIQK